MDKIDGYEIQKTILFETGYGFALGCIPETPEKCAVWNFTETAFGRDYYWKACYESRDVAEENFQKKGGTLAHDVRDAGKDGTQYRCILPLLLTTAPGGHCHFPAAGREQSRYDYQL